MSRPIRWTARAIRRLDWIGTFIAMTDPRAAAMVVRRIVEATARLADQPELGRPGRVAGTRELVLVDVRHIVPYRVRPDRVEILTVMHMAQRWPDAF